MKEGAILLLTLTFYLNMDVTIATTRLNITGPGTNMTALLLKIFLKGSGEWIPNLIPDMTFNDKTKDRIPGTNAQVGRRSLKQFLTDQRKYFSDAVDMFVKPHYQPKKEEEEANIQTSDDTSTSLKDIARRVLTAIGLKNLAPTRREVVHVHQHHVKIDQENFLVNKQHLNKMRELKIFMEHNYKATDYFYSELKRVQKTSVVIDDLRKMVDWIGKHMGDGPGVKYAFKCFHDRKPKDHAALDLWKNRVPNNVYIDPIKDPYDYGVGW